MAEFECVCCGDRELWVLFPAVDPDGNQWCDVCWDHEFRGEESKETYGTYIPDICYRHEYDEHWAKLMDELYGF